MKDLTIALKENGLSEEFEEENIIIGDHGNADIVNLDKDTCINLVTNLNNKKLFKKIIHCRPIVGKSGEESSESEEDSSDVEEEKDIRINSKLLNGSDDDEGDNDDDIIEKAKEAKRETFIKNTTPKNQDSDYKLVEKKNGKKRKTISPNKSAEEQVEKKVKDSHEKKKQNIKK